MKILLIVPYLLLLMSVARPGQEPQSKEYSNPERFEQKIRDFELMDKQKMPPPAAIVFIGSSTIRGWHSAITEDLAPLTIIPRGFGGSNMNDALHFIDRIVIPYKPRAIVVYEGDNDIADGIAPQKIQDTFRTFTEKVHKELPETRIYFLSIKPSISRWKVWPQMQETNQLIGKYCLSDERLSYVDMAEKMLDANRQPRKDIFKKDNLHMNRAGYEIWRDVLKPVLIKAELPFEVQKDSSVTDER